MADEARAGCDSIISVMHAKAVEANAEWTARVAGKVLPAQGCEAPGNGVSCGTLASGADEACWATRGLACLHSNGRSRQPGGVRPADPLEDAHARHRRTADLRAPPVAVYQSTMVEPVR